MALRKKLINVTVEDLLKHPVWEMIEDARDPDVFVIPVSQVPVTSMMNRLAGTQLQLADGSRYWALLGNISPKDSLSTRHFLTVSICSQEKWFDLARYHDVDYSRRDGVALASFLGKKLADVFPITYDLTPLVRGDRDALVGTISHPVDSKLSEDELIRLSLQDE